MPDTASFFAFLVAALILLLIPGPGVLYVIARSVTQGQRAGLVSVLGLSTGALVHVAAATVGLSAILLTSATAFGVVKALGAAYLIYLGIRALMTRQSATSAEKPISRPTGRLFVDGVLISVLNPKIAIFFLAFLPQFVDPQTGSATAQILFLGISYVGLALLTDGAYALVASRLGQAFGRRVLQGSIPRYGSGAVYIGLGVSTALVDRD